MTLQEARKNIGRIVKFDAKQGHHQNQIAARILDIVGRRVLVKPGGHKHHDVLARPNDLMFWKKGDHSMSQNKGSK